MKKTVLILAFVVAAVAGTYFADKATRVKVKVEEGIGESSAGKPAPEFSAKDLNDKDVTLAQFKGKVVLVNFWATWCGPCRIEMPWLIEMQQKYGDRGFTVVGVAMDEEGKSAVAPFIEKERYEVNGKQAPVNYPIVLGNDALADKFGGLLGYPTSVLISRDGKIIQRITGLISYDDIAKAIESQL